MSLWQVAEQLSYEENNTGSNQIVMYLDYLKFGKSMMRFGLNRRSICLLKDLKFRFQEIMTQSLESHMETTRCVPAERECMIIPVIKGSWKSFEEE